MTSVNPSVARLWVRGVSPHCKRKFHGGQRGVIFHVDEISVTLLVAPLCERLCGQGFQHNKTPRTWQVDRHRHHTTAHSNVSFEKVTGTGRPKSGTCFSWLLLGERFTNTHGPKWVKLTIINHRHLLELLPKHGTAKSGFAVPHSEVVRQQPCC